MLLCSYYKTMFCLDMKNAYDIKPTFIFFQGIFENFKDE